MIVDGYPNFYQTERLKMRPLNLDDTVVWRQFLADENCTRYFPSFMKMPFKEHAIIWVEKQICRYRDKKGGLLALIDKESGAFVGQAGLLVQDVNGVAELEIGYHLLPQFWGKGFASEASVFFRHLGFRIYPVKSIISIIDVRNENSKKVALKNDMKLSKNTQWRDLDVEIYRVIRK